MSDEGQKRTDYYRERAIEMLELAEKAPTDATRVSYFELAATWSQLAQEMEKPHRWRRDPGRWQQRG